MIRGTLLSTMLIIISLGVHAQCNTTLNKLLPEKSVNNDDRFGSALDASENYMVIAAENSDTLGILYGGAAYVYEKTAAGWAYRALLIPSDPIEYDFFGNDVAIDATGNTIIIINRSYTKGGVYIFEKPSAGWETMTETVKITLPDYLEFNASVDVSDDGSTIAVSSPGTEDAKFYIFLKPGGGWNNLVTPQIYTGPDFGSSFNQFGMDIHLKDDYLYLTSDNDPSGSGIYIYKRNGTVYNPLAKLSNSLPLGVTAYFGRYLAVSDDMIATMGLVYQNGTLEDKLFVYKKNNGEWEDATESAQVKIPGYNSSYRFPFPIQFVSPTQLVASVLVKGGTYYTGKVLQVTADDLSWQNLTHEVIFQEEELASNSEFAGQMVWNGTDLIRTVSFKRSGMADRNAAISLTRSLNFWGSTQQITLNRYTSSNVKFGSSVVKTKDALFTGAPYDGTSGKGAGAVYVYEKSGDDFIKTHAILPSRRKIRPEGGSDAGFGYSLAVYEDELAIGAPSYKYSSENYGKIFLYKRTSGSWTSAVLYDSLVAPEELDLNHIGAAIVMNDHFLFASAYNNYNNEHTNAVLVYEKINGKWTFQEVLKAGKPLDKSWPSIKLSLYGDELMIGSYFAIGGGVTLKAKNSDNGTWETKLFISGAVYSGFGTDVKLEADHFFVGAAAYDYKDIAKSGAVFVYTKLPGQEWGQSPEPSAIIGAEIPLEGAYFGSSLDVIGNTMAVGAPGKFLTQDNLVRTIPGNTYIIQAQDYYWTNTTQFINLQGDRYAQNERDHFGADVGVDEDYFYIGAQNENTFTGMFSGAAYYIATPPVIFLHPPVCSGSDVVQLNAYPFNGTWSGPGIEDPSGKFNPVIAGIGLSTLIYTTSNCNYQGTVQIEVKSPISIGQISPSNVNICSEGQIGLQLESIPSAIYDWYYKPDAGNDFVFIGSGGAERFVTNSGQYFANVTESGCLVESPVFTVSIEDMQLNIGPQNVVCAHDQIVPLIVSDNTGTWEGMGVQNGNFYSGKLENAFYKLTYKVTTPSGCEIAVHDSIKINVIEPPKISRSGDYCETGAIDLNAEPVNSSLEYSWNFSAIAGTDLTPIQKPLISTATVFDQGYYSVSVTNGDCSLTSQVINVGFDKDLVYQLSPEENSETEFCNEQQYELVINSREGTNYIWEYRQNDSDSYEILTNSTANDLIVTESGFYRVSGEYGFCSFQSRPVSIQFTVDSIFVPNVFTPNGDVYNPTFSIESTSNILQLKIFNRYGHEIYSSPTGQWDGGEAPAGVYYWYIKYQGCDTRDKELKGWVSLLR